MTFGGGILMTAFGILILLFLPIIAVPLILMGLAMMAGGKLARKQRAWCRACGLRFDLPPDAGKGAKGL
jgi:hypothetical protein